MAPPPIPSSPAASLESGIFVTGTDTAVGKTTVAMALLRLAARRGHRSVPFKPAETGCVGGHPQDAARLRQAARRADLPLARICPFQFTLPVAPAAAAEAEGKTIALPDLLSAAQALRSAGEALVAEGAGGLLVPYGPSLTALDLAEALGLPVLVVARNSLGTINHSALTLAALARRRLALAGLILVDTTATVTPDRASNARLIESVSGVRPLGVLPFLPEFGSASDDALADAAADALEFSLAGDPLWRRWLPEKIE